MATLKSSTMVAVFDQMRKMRGYVDADFSGRDWNLATAMVMNGEAAFQIMGDWAKGEFLAAGKRPGIDFLCASTPGEGFLYNVDSFAMFAVDGADKQAGQALLAELIVGQNFQKTFNLNKGSIPARTDVALMISTMCARICTRYGSKQLWRLFIAIICAWHGTSRCTSWCYHRCCNSTFQL